MAQLTAEERRRIFLNRQEIDREIRGRRSAPVHVSAPLARGRRFGRIAEVALTAAVLGAGWFISQAVAFHVPASLAEMLPRL